MTAVNLGRLEEALLEVLPAEAISTGIGGFAVARCEPLLAARPADQASVAACLAVASQQDTAVISWGGGTQMSLGMPPARYDLALDMRGLDRVVEYEPADLTVTVEAGMTLSGLQSMLSAHGQWLPLDPPVSAAATIGGVLATNASGPARVRYGTLRDLLIGITLATPQGELVHAGGRVVKNVAGYDLGKLQIGALGTLGVIVQASFKVAPLPASCLILTSPVTDLARATSLSFAVRNASLPATAIVISRGGDDAEWGLTLRFAAGAAAVERSRRELDALAAGTGLTFSEAPALQEMDSAGKDTVVARASVLPSMVEGILETFAATGAAIEAYPTAGTIRAAWPGNVSVETLLALRRRCRQAGRGALVIEAAPPEIKSAVDVWGETRGDFALMRALKAEFDPQGILSPGRFVGGL